MQAKGETFVGIFVISKVHLTNPNPKFLQFWTLTWSEWQVGTKMTQFLKNGPTVKNEL